MVSIVVPVHNIEQYLHECLDSLAAQTYANIIAVKEGSENDAKIKALVDAVKSDEVKKFIEEKYEGAVVPVF